MKTKFFIEEIIQMLGKKDQAITHHNLDKVIRITYGTLGRNVKGERLRHIV